MAQLEIRGPYHPLGPDSPRELENKLNNNYRELLTAAGAAASFMPLRLTYSSTDGGLDSLRQLEAKLNAMNQALAAAVPGGGVLPPALQLTAPAPRSPFTPADVSTPATLPPLAALQQPWILRLLLAFIAAIAAAGFSPQIPINVLTLAGEPLTLAGMYLTLGVL